VAITGLGVAISRTADDLDNLAKQSRRLEFPIEDLQEWRFVAEQSGIEADQFSKGLDKFAKNFGEMKGGFGTMFSNLKRLDPQLKKQLDGVTDLGQAFDLYIKAMRDAKTPAERAALGAAAFGRSGIKMANITNLTAEEVTKLREEMIANGVATMEQAEAAEAFNDSMNSLKLAAGGFLRDVIVPLLPLLTKAARAIREWAVQNRELISARVEGVIMGIVRGVRFLIAAGRKLIEVWKKIRPFIDIVVDGVRRLWDESQPIVQQLAGLFEGSFEGAVQTTQDVVDAIVSIWGEIAPIIGRALGAVKKIWAVIAPALIGGFELVKSVVISISPAVKKVVGSILSAVERLAPVFEKVFGLIGAIFQTLAPVIGPVLGWILDTVATVFGGVLDIVVSIIERVVNTIWKIPAAWRTAVDFVVSIMETGMAAINALIDRAKKSGAFAKLMQIAEALKPVWEGVRDTITGVWDSIVSAVSTAVGKIKKLVQPIAGILKKVAAAQEGLIREGAEFLGIGGGDEEGAAPAAAGDAGGRPQVISREERIARSIEEKRDKSTLGITVRDETGRADVTESDLGSGMTLAYTGGF
jgi:phage-related protein